MSRFTEDHLQRASVARQTAILDGVTLAVIGQAALLERFLAENEVQQHPAVQDKVQKLTDALQNLSDQVGDLYIRVHEE